MSDPKRLLTDGSDFERAMLEAWEAERPSAAARERVLAIVGAGAIVGIGATAAASGAAGAAVRGGASIAKWIAVGALAIATTAATIAFVRHDSRHRDVHAVSGLASTHAASTPPAIDSAPAPLETAPLETAPAIASPAIPDAIPSPASLAPAISAKRPASPRASQKNDPSVAIAASLNAQIAWLDRARRAIEAGDPATALHLLDDYRATYPEGTLSQEAELLRIEALIAGGQRAAAESLATRFIAAHPSSPHARRIRELVNPPPSH